VKAADNVALMAEKRDLMGLDRGDWGLDEMASPDRIYPNETWRQSEQQFLQRCDEVWSLRVLGQ
jgi:hypothetical protein